MAGAQPTSTTLGERVERRRHTRYDLSAPATFFWKSRGGPRQDGEGFTRDLAQGGMFIFTDMPPPIGTVVQVDVLFPPFKAGSALQMRSKCEVLRVEPGAPGETRSGFAAISKSFALRNSKIGAPGKTGMPGDGTN